MDAPIPRPASGPMIMSAVKQLEQKIDSLTQVISAMKREQERLNQIVAQQQLLKAREL